MKEILSTVTVVEVEVVVVVAGNFDVDAVDCAVVEVVVVANVGFGDDNMATEAVAMVHVRAVKRKGKEKADLYPGEVVRKQSPGLGIGQTHSHGCGCPFMTIVLHNRRTARPECDGRRKRNDGMYNGKRAMFITTEAK
jgi:hypothetical protein